VRLGPSTPGDYVRTRVLVPRNPGVTARGSVLIRTRPRSSRAMFHVPSACYVARVRASFARCSAVSRVVNSSRYVARVRASFARCSVVSRVVNSSRLESQVLIKSLN
jgi:hypothetical protein